MFETAVQTSADYDIRVAQDQLTATVRLEPGGTIDAKQLLRQLTRAGIQFIDEAAINAAAAELQQTKQQAADQPQAGETPAKPQGITLVVARGKPKVEDVPESLEKIEPPLHQGPPANHYERVRIETVNPGEQIARVKPAVVGVDGVDVFGRPIPRRRSAKPVVPGEGTKREGDLVLSERAGRVRIDGDRIRVEPRLDIPGDICFATGNIRFDGDINISGSILDLFLVGGTADIHVGGTIEAAKVHAGGNVIVGGGIAGKDKGQVTAGGAMKCRYISNANVYAGADVNVAGEIANSRVVCGGRLAAENGPIRSSHVTANGGVACRSLGNPAFVKTIIEAGIDPRLRQLAHDLLPDLQRCLNNAQHTKDIVQTMLRDRKRLSAKEREKTTELLFAAAGTDRELAGKLAEFRSAFELSQQRRRAEVIVTDTIYPGVTIRLPGLEATISTAFRGPLKLAAVGDRKKQIAVMNEISGSVILLNTFRVADEGIDELETILSLAA